MKEGALRLATYFAAAAEQKPNHTVRISTRELSEKTGLVPSSLNRAINELCDPKANFVTARRGSKTQPTAYMINFLETVRGASFGEAPPKKAPPQTELSFEQQGASFREAPPTENTRLTKIAAASDFDPALLSLIARVFSSKPKNFDKATVTEYRHHLYGLYARFGRDENNRPFTQTNLPPYPTDDLVAIFLACGDERGRQRFLQEFLHECQAGNHPPSSYIYFVYVALARLQRIKVESIKEGRALLRDVKQQQVDAGEAPDQKFTQETMFSALAGVKNLR